METLNKKDNINKIWDLISTGQKTVKFVKQRNKMLKKLEATYSSASFRRLALAEEDRFKSPPVPDEGQGEIKKKRGWGRCMNKKSPPSYLWDNPQSTAPPPPSRQLRQKNTDVIQSPKNNSKNTGTKTLTADTGAEKHFQNQVAPGVQDGSRYHGDESQSQVLDGLHADGTDNRTDRTQNCVSGSRQRVLTSHKPSPVDARGPQRPPLARGHRPVRRRRHPLETGERVGIPLVSEM